MDWGIIDWGSVEWGNVAEWVSGLGALTASVVALVVARRAQQAAREERRAAARAASRERTTALLVQLIAAVEKDIAAAEAASGEYAVITSPEGTALCRALWSYRNLFGTTWAVYCEGDENYKWIHQLRRSDQLFPRMREELQSAIDALDHEDRAA